MQALLDSFPAWPSLRRQLRPLVPGNAPVALSNHFQRNPPIPATRSVADEELMRRYRGGDAEAFRTLYERYRAPLLHFIRRTAIDSSDVEEIVQETWMAVIRGRERYVPQARFVTYLFSIGRRRSVDGWRRRGRQPELEDSDAIDLIPAPQPTQPESIIGEEALAAALATAIQALPLLQRETLLLRADTDLSVDEIAQVTGTTRETAKSRLRYGLRRLRAALEPWK